MRKVRYRGVVDYEDTHLKMRQLLESMKLVAGDANFTKPERREVGYLAQALLHRAQYLLVDDDKASEDEQDLLMDIVEVTPGNIDVEVDERSWADLIMNVAMDLEGLLQSEGSFVEKHSAEVSSKDAPHFLRELADKWDKSHPQVECSECKGQGYRDSSKKGLKCGTCLGSGKVRAVVIDVPVKVTVRDGGATRKEALEELVDLISEAWSNKNG